MSSHEKPKKQVRLGKVRWVLAAICFLIACFSGWKLLGMIKEYREGDETYSSIEDIAFTPIAPEDTEDDNDGNSEQPPENTSNVIVIPKINFKALKKVNPDVVAWVYLPGSVINYPIVSGKDNSYYLTHTVDKKVNKAGCPFVDYRNAKGFEDRNTIIYGHHLRNGKMFTGLHKYKNQAYYDEHPVIYFMLPEGQYALLVFSGYTTKSTSDAYKRTFSSDKEFSNWLNTVKKRSNFKSDVSVGPDDTIITLSTCAYNFDNARYVVHCKLVKYTDSLGNAFDLAAN